MEIGRCHQALMNEIRIRTALIINGLKVSAYINFLLSIIELNTIWKPLITKEQTLGLRLPYYKF